MANQCHNQSFISSKYYAVNIFCRYLKYFLHWLLCCCRAELLLRWAPVQVAGCGWGGVAHGPGVPGQQQADVLAELLPAELLLPADLGLLAPDKPDIPHLQLRQLRRQRGGQTSVREGVQTSLLWLCSVGRETEGRVDRWHSTKSM